VRERERARESESERERERPTQGDHERGTRNVPKVSDRESACLWWEGGSERAQV